MIIQDKSILQKQCRAVFKSIIMDFLRKDYQIRIRNLNWGWEYITIFTALWWWQVDCPSERRWDYMCQSGLSFCTSYPGLLWHYYIYFTVIITCSLLKFIFYIFFWLLPKKFHLLPSCWTTRPHASNLIMIRIWFSIFSPGTLFWSYAPCLSALRISNYKCTGPCVSSESGGVRSSVSCPRDTLTCGHRWPALSAAGIFFYLKRWQKSKQQCYMVKILHYKQNNYSLLVVQ